MIFISRWKQLVFATLIMVAIVLVTPTQRSMGLLYFNAKEYAEAYKILNKMGHDVASLKRLKDYNLLQGNTDQSYAIQKILVSLRPKNIEYWKELATLADWNYLPKEKMQAKEAQIELTPKKDQEQLIYEIGQEYWWLGDSASAERMFNKIQQTNNLERQLDLLNFYIQRQKKVQVLNLARSILNNKGIPLPAAEKATSSLVDLGLYQEAITYYLVRFGNSPSYRTFYGSAEFLGNKPQVVEQKMGEVLRIKELYGAQEDFKTLTLIQEKLVKLFPKNMDYRWELVGYLSWQKRYEEASGFLDQFTSIKSSNEKALLQVAQKLDSLGLPQKSIAYYERLVTLRPTYLPYLQILAKKYEETGQTHKALDIYYKILRHYNLKRKVFFKYEPEGKIILLAMATSGDAFYSLMRENSLTSTERIFLQGSGKEVFKIKKKLAQLHDEVGETDKSIALYEELLSSDPNNLEFKKKLAQRYIWTGQRDKALTLCEEILRKDPKIEWVQTFFIEEEIRQGNYQRAQKMLNRHLRQHPFTNSTDLELKNAMEEIYYQNDKTEHQKFCSQIISRNKTTEFSLQLRCLTRLGEYQQVSDILNQRIKKYPSKVEYHVHKVNVLLEMRRLEEAEAELKLIKEKFKTWTSWNDEQQKYLASLREERKNKKAWYVKSSTQAFFFSDYHYVQENIKFYKYLSEKLTPGLDIGGYHSWKGLKKSFGEISPFFRFPVAGVFQEVGYTFYEGNVRPKQPSFFWRMEYLKGKKTFWSFSYQHAKPQVDILPTVTNKLEKSHLSFYRTSSISSRFQYDLAYEYFNYRTPAAEKGNDHHFSFEGLGRLTSTSPFSLGYRGIYTQFSSSSSLLNSIFIEKSFSHYAIGQYRYFRPHGLDKSDELKLRLLVGGDHLRHINFGDTKIAEVYYRKQFTAVSYFNASFQYSTQTSQFYSDNLKVFNVEFQYRF